MENVTGSRLQRVLACPASAALPQAESTSDAAELGTDIHRVLAAYADRTTDALSPSDRGLLERVDTDAVVLGTMPERPYTYDLVADAAVSGHHPGAGRITTTLDAVVLPTVPHPGESWTNEHETAEVRDYKTGWSELPHPLQSAQLLFGALCVARAHGLSRVRVSYARVPLDTVHWVKSAEEDVFDLEAFAGKLRLLPERIRAAQMAIDNGIPVTVNEGPHCNYCPAKLHCPAKTALIRNITDPETRERHLRLHLTEETVAEAYRRWRDARDLVTALGQAINGWASHTPIQLGDGKAYGLHMRPGKERVVDAAVVGRVIAEKLGPEYEDVAVLSTPHATKGSITSAVRKAKADGQATGTLKDNVARVLDRLREAGALERRETTAICEYELAACATCGTESSPYRRECQECGA